MPFLHAHTRRVPAQDVDRSVVVGMSAQAAMATVEVRLAFAAFTVHGSAGRTGLRGVGGIDLAKASSAFFELVGKDGLEAEPALIENAPVQPGLLAHHAARRFNRASRGGRHVFDAQLFQNHGSEAPADIEGCLVGPVAANAGTSGGQTGRTADGDTPAVGSFLASRHRALCGTAAPFEGFEAGGNAVALAGRKHQRDRHTAIDADARTDIGRDGLLNLTGEGDVPAERIESDGDVPDRAAQGRVSGNFTQPIFGRRRADHLPFSFRTSTSRP